MLVVDILAWGTLFVFFIAAFAITFFLLLREEENFESFAGTCVRAREGGVDASACLTNSVCERGR
jgi:hypothetical protein